MFDAAMTGHSSGKRVLSNRRSIRRLRAAIFFRMLTFTRKPSMSRVLVDMLHPIRPQRTPRVFEFFYDPAKFSREIYAGLRSRFSYPIFPTSGRTWVQNSTVPAVFPFAPRASKCSNPFANSTLDPQQTTGKSRCSVVAHAL